MKGTAITVLALLAVCGAARAQNNPIFYGGATDGHSTGRNTPVAASNQGGGSGDGTGGGISNAGFAANQTGGLGDGTTTGIKASIPPISNAGGVGDGSGVIAKSSQHPLTNTGGVGDGATAGIKTALPPLTNSGGAGDGAASVGKAAPPAVTNGGGVGDGYAQQSTTPVLPVNQRGGLGDGWSGQRVVVAFAPSVPLPQEFFSFTAKKQGADALLNWAMGDEKGIDRYEVERSSNAVTFSKIGEVVWQEAVRGKYSFTDLKPLRGHNYYRIRVMSGSGEKLTPVRLLIFDEPASTLAMTLYPNPATARITAALPLAWLGTNTVLNVYSAAGTLVLQQKLVPLNVAEVSLPVDALAPGVYTLQAATDAESLRAPFVKR